MLTGHLLQSHQREQMTGAMTARLNVPSHQCGGAAKPAAVHLEHNRTPFPGRQLFGAEPSSHRLIQHFRRGAGNRAQTRGNQALDHGLQGNPILLSNEEQLLRGEGVQMQAWCCGVEGLQQGLVVAKR